MFIYCIGYRHADGGIRGYAGYGLLHYSAQVAARASLNRVLHTTGEMYYPDRQINSRKDCTTEEYGALKRQWRAIRKAIKNRGASIY